jgi:hypothetical protein
MMERKKKVDFLCVGENSVTVDTPSGTEKFIPKSHLPITEKHAFAI